MRSAAKLPSYFFRGDGALRSAANAAVALRRWPETVVYDLAFGRVPNYVHPQTYTEKVQWRKLFDRNPELITWCDKLAARDLATERAPNVRLPELLWTGTDPEAIPLDSLAPPYVLKANNRSGALIFVRTAADLNPDRMRAAGRRWMEAAPHRQPSYEWAYSGVPTRIFAEEVLPGFDEGESPPDLKIFVFGGQARFLYYRDAHRGDLGVFSRDWKLYEWDRWERVVDSTRIAYDSNVPPPRNLESAVSAAESIAGGIDHLRVDLYVIEEDVYFGEATVYPSSGNKIWIPHDATADPHPPDDVDTLMGSTWELPTVSTRDMARSGLGWGK